MNDDDLRRLLDDTVSDVDPPHRLDAIRTRTSSIRTSSLSRRPWWLAGGAAVAVASVATAVVAARGPAPDHAPPVAADPHTHAAALYFVGDTPSGPRLFREFQQVPDDDPAAILAALSEPPDDPDYRTDWEPGKLVDVSRTDEQITVTLTTTRATRLGDQQLTRTLQAYFGVMLPVQPLLEPHSDGKGGESVISLGLLPIETDSSVLADVSISDPTEGREVVGSFTARGVANSPEGTVPWQITDSTGATVEDGFAPAAGAYDRLYPWRTEIDVSDLDPGTYTFSASTDDPSGGEGPGPTTDTRTIVVE